MEYAFQLDNIYEWQLNIITHRLVLTSAKNFCRVFWFLKRTCTSCTSTSVTNSSFRIFLYAIGLLHYSWLLLFHSYPSKNELHYTIYIFRGERMVTLLFECFITVTSLLFLQNTVCFKSNAVEVFLCELVFVTPFPFSAMK